MTKERKPPRPGRYNTIAGWVRDRCKVLQEDYEDLPRKLKLSPKTVAQANSGGPSFRTTLKALGEALDIKDWRSSLDPDFHPELVIAASPLFDAFAKGEEFGALRRLGSEQMITKSLAAPETKQLAEKV